MSIFSLPCSGTETHVLWCRHQFILLILFRHFLQNSFEIYDHDFSTTYDTDRRERHSLLQRMYKTNVTNNCKCVKVDDNFSLIIKVHMKIFHSLFLGRIKKHAESPTWLVEPGIILFARICVVTKTSLCCVLSSPGLSKCPIRRC